MHHARNEDEDTATGSDVHCATPTPPTDANQSCVTINIVR